MIAGHLREKDGIYHIVLNYHDADGKRRTKWKSTNLPVKGNKKRATEMLQAARQDFIPPIKPGEEIRDGWVLFADFLENWLEIAKPTVKLATYASYKEMLRMPILPYFRKSGVSLQALTTEELQTFYGQRLKKVSASTVIHYHAVIHRALKYAVKMKLIPLNPAANVERPRVEKFVGSFYDSDEVNKLLEVSRGTRFELAAWLGAFYGLRRAEMVGLR